MYYLQQPNVTKLLLLLLFKPPTATKLKQNANVAFKTKATASLVTLLGTDAPTPTQAL